MRRYYLSSAALHLSLLAFFFLFSWFHRSPNFIMIDGFDFDGTGGGGDGRSSAGGPKASQMGQVVPQPVKVPIPAKPAPVQKATKAEEEWAIKKQKEVKPEKVQKAVETPVEQGEKTQKEQTNIIRRGVSPNTQAGEGGYDFGPGGAGTGKGIGIGMGFGPGEGGGFGGFGSYLKILRQRIWSEWTQSAVYGSNQICVVGLTVDRSGDVSDIKIEKASGNSFYDNVAMRAVRNAAPLPPLPSSFPKDQQRFRIQFRLLE
jgi:TonB family protein